TRRADRTSAPPQRQPPPAPPPDHSTAARPPPAPAAAAADAASSSGTPPTPQRHEDALEHQQPGSVARYPAPPGGPLSPAADKQASTTAGVAHGLTTSPTHRTADTHQHAVQRPCRHPTEKRHTPNTFAMHTVC